jgi:exo-beta-1,3-glucanase (GH17 family)
MGSAQRQQAVANIGAPLASISYSPYSRSQHPDFGDRPTPEQIRADLKILARYTQAIRTYPRPMAASSYRRSPPSSG